MELETTSVTPDAAVDDTSVSDPAGTPASGDTAPVIDGNADDQPTGQPRDSRGRFSSYVEGTDEADPTEGADGNLSDATDSPDAQPAPDAQAATPPEPGEAEGTPFTIRHRGQEYGLANAVVDKDGNLRVGRESVEQLRSMLASAREYQTFGRQREQQTQRELRALQAQVQARHEGIERFAQLLEAGDELTAMEAFLDLRAKWPQVKYEFERARLEAENKALREGRDPRAGDGPELDDETTQHLQVVTATIDHHLAGIRKAVPEYAALTDADLAAIAPEVRRRAFVYMREATPDDQMLHGIPVGSPVCDLDLFSQVFASFAAPVLQTRNQQAAEARKRAAAEQARKVNADRTRQPASTPPAAPTTRVTTPPKKDDGKITKEEWNRIKGG